MEGGWGRGEEEEGGRRRRRRGRSRRRSRRARTRKRRKKKTTLIFKLCNEWSTNPLTRITSVVWGKLSMDVIKWNVLVTKKLHKFVRGGGHGGPVLFVFWGGGGVGVKKSNV